MLRLFRYCAIIILRQVLAAIFTQVSSSVRPLSGWFTLAMDAHTSKIRSEDGICRLGLNQQSRMNQRTLLKSQVDTLRVEQQLAKEWNTKIKDDMYAQKLNIKAMHRHM